MSDTIRVSHSVSGIITREYPVILPATPTSPAVVAVPDYSPDAPDYDADASNAELLLGWWRGWSHSWQSGGTHAVDPAAILRAAKEFDDTDMLTRWLNIVSPSGISYHVSKHYGHMQGDQWLYIQAYPTDSPDSVVNGEHSEPVNWARGDVHALHTVTYDPDSDTYFLNAPGVPYSVYGPSDELDREDTRDDAYDFLSSLD